MVDWAAFCSSATKLDEQFSVQRLKICLLHLDPNILTSYTFFWRLFVRLKITNFQFGRDLCWGRLISILLKKNPQVFSQAPVEAVQKFNHLLDTLLRPELARKLYVSSHAPAVDTRLRENMPYEKRLQAFLQEAAPFQDLLEAANQLPKNNHLNNITEHQRTLVELEKRLDVRKKKRAEIVQRREKLAKLTPFAFPGAKQHAAWDALLTSLQDASCDETAERNLQILENGKALEKQLIDFSVSLADTWRFLKDNYVERVLVSAEESLLQLEPPAEIARLLDEQKRLILAFNKEIQENGEIVRKQAAPYVQKLFQPEFLLFKDLPREAERIFSVPFVPKEVFDGLISNEIISHYRQELKGFNEQQIKKVSDLVETAKIRTRKIEEMERFHEAVTKVAAQVRVFKDLKAELDKIEQAARDVYISKQELSKAGFDEIETLLADRFKNYQNLMQSIPHLTDELNWASKQSEQHLVDDKMAIKRRLFEIFWNISPYQDLSENFLSMRELLSTQLHNLVVQFYAGKISSSEFLTGCQEMPYEHDVVKLRNEITHRSSRLKDLRDEALRLFEETLGFRRKLELVSYEHQVLHSEFVVLQKAISEILLDIENPFKTFSQATNRDEVNYVFRNLWIRIEDVQPKLEKAKEQAIQIVAKSAAVYKAKFLRALDSLEELIKLQTGNRPTLVSKVERELEGISQEQLYNAVEAQIHLYEGRFPFIDSFVFFMLFSDHATRLAVLQEAEALDLVLQETVSFAKEMQFVKTFEEERVDIILEAFERQHLIEEQTSRPDDLLKAFKSYKARMLRAADLVEEEIFLDIGLLDRHALMDVNPADLMRTLHSAIKRAQGHKGIFVRIKEAEAASSGLYKKMCSDLEKEVNTWIGQELPPATDLDMLLEHLRNYCHHLFDAKVIVASKGGMLLPKCLDFVNQLRSLSSLIEVWVQAKRTHKGWGVPWIQECFLIRAEIESFEPEHEDASSYQPLVKKVMAHLNLIPELKSGGKEALQIPEITSELESRLQEIDALVKNPKVEYPFIYIPGYVAFFQQ